MGGRRGRITTDDVPPCRGDVGNRAMSSRCRDADTAVRGPCAVARLESSACPRRDRGGCWPNSRPGTLVQGCSARSCVARAWTLAVWAVWSGDSRHTSPRTTVGGAFRGIGIATAAGTPNDRRGGVGSRYAARYCGHMERRVGGMSCSSLRARLVRKSRTGSTSAAASDTAAKSASIEAPKGGHDQRQTW
jgi:hypothetical protein